MREEALGDGEKQKRRQKSSSPVHKDPKEMTTSIPVQRWLVGRRRTTGGIEG
jgi:hypothetical protein